MTATTKFVLENKKRCSKTLFSILYKGYEDTSYYHFTFHFISNCSAQAYLEPAIGVQEGLAKMKLRQFNTAVQYSGAVGKGYEFKITKGRFDHVITP